jgi:hypothetical protein
VGLAEPNTGKSESIPANEAHWGSSMLDIRTSHDRANLIGSVPESKLNAYLKYVRRSETPKYEDAAGLISFCVLQRPFVAYVELLTISFWQSEQVLPRFLEGQSPADAEIGSCGAIQLETRNYTVLISGEGKPQAAEDEPQD